MNLQKELLWGLWVLTTAKRRRAEYGASRKSEGWVVGGDDDDGQDADDGAAAAAAAADAEAEDEDENENENEDEE